MDGVPNDVVGWRARCVAGKGCVGKPDCVCGKLERSLMRLNLF